MSNPQKIFLAFLALLATISLIVWLYPRGGYDFPSAPEIASINAKFRCAGKDERAFEIPRPLYEEVLFALSPSAYDRFAQKWQLLGELQIRNIDGSLIFVELFDVGDQANGAFAAGPTYQSRIYYRGGDTSKLRSVLEKAYEGATIGRN